MNTEPKNAQELRETILSFIDYVSNSNIYEMKFSYLGKPMLLLVENYGDDEDSKILEVYVDDHQVCFHCLIYLKQNETELDAVVKRIDLVANNRAFDIYKEPFQWSVEHAHGSDENIIGKFTLNELGEYIESDYLLSSPDKNHYFVLRCIETDHWFGVEYVRGVCDALKECA